MYMAVGVCDAYLARSALSALGMMFQTYVDLCLSLWLVVLGWLLRGRFVHELNKTLAGALSALYGVEG